MGVHVGFKDEIGRGELSLPTDGRSSLHIAENFSRPEDGKNIAATDGYYLPVPTEGFSVLRMANSRRKAQIRRSFVTVYKDTLRWCAIAKLLERPCLPQDGPRLAHWENPYRTGSHEEILELLSKKLRYK